MIENGCPRQRSGNANLRSLSNRRFPVIAAEALMASATFAILGDLSWQLWEVIMSLASFCDLAHNVCTGDQREQSR
jgi:hypothetical protein